MKFNEETAEQSAQIKATAFIATKLSNRLSDNYAFRVVGTRRVSPPH